jgi:hypothetical protein
MQAIVSIWTPSKPWASDHSINPDMMLDDIIRQKQATASAFDQPGTPA